jgi:hypothetical protein
MTVKAEEAWTISPVFTPTYIIFETAATTARAERLRITSAGNIGIGTSTPTQKLEVSGGIKLNTATARPTCDTSARGTFWVTKGGTGVADKVEICVKGDTSSTENYGWKSLF